MLLKSTGEFLDTGLQKSGNEFWESADDSTASDEIRYGVKRCFISVLFISGVLKFHNFDSCRRSVIETSRSLKELFHEARERASKALGFAKMLRKVSSCSETESHNSTGCTDICAPVFSAL